MVDLFKDGAPQGVHELRNGHQDAHPGLLHAGDDIGAFETVQDRRGAKRERQQHAGHGRVGMVEREQAEKVVRLINNVELDGAGTVRRQVAVREHHALGVARGAGSIEDRSQVVIRGRGGAAALPDGSSCR